MEFVWFILVGLVAGWLARMLMKATELVNFLKKEFGLGHGHSMAMWAVFKEKGWVASPKRK